LPLLGRTLGAEFAMKKGDNISERLCLRRRCDDDRRQYSSRLGQTWTKILKSLFGLKVADPRSLPVNYGLGIVKVGYVDRKVHKP
jgi:hypothetical protein